MKMASVVSVTIMLYMIMTSVESRKISQSRDLNRIIGGRDAKENEFPHQVSLQEFSGMHFCGGSIINEHNILTAAHCSEFTAVSNMRVVAGVNRLSRQPVVSTFVWKMFLHQKYNRLTVHNDIAIAAVILRLPIGSGKVDKIPLASSPISEGSAITVTGWGFVKQEPPKLPDVLQAVELYVIGSVKCREVFSKQEPGPEAIKGGMICAGNKGDGKDSCNGDSGGPAVAGGELVGLVSWGPTKCGVPDIPGVYSDVYYYRTWIEGTVNRSAYLMSRISASTEKIGNVLLLLLAIASVLRL